MPESIPAIALVVMLGFSLGRRELERIVAGRYFIDAEDLHINLRKAGYRIVSLFYGQGAYMFVEKNEYVFKLSQDPNLESCISVAAQLESVSCAPQA